MEEPPRAKPWNHRCRVRFEMTRSKAVSWLCPCDLRGYRSRMLLVFLFLHGLGFGVGEIAEHLYPAVQLLGDEGSILLVDEHAAGNSELSGQIAAGAEEREQMTFAVENLN